MKVGVQSRHIQVPILPFSASVSQDPEKERALKPTLEENGVPHPDIGNPPATPTMKGLP